MDQSSSNLTQGWVDSHSQAANSQHITSWPSSGTQLPHRPQPDPSLSAGLFGGLLPVLTGTPFSSPFAPKDLRVKPPEFLGSEGTVSKIVKELDSSVMQCEEIGPTRECTPCPADDTTSEQSEAKEAEGADIRLDYTSGSLLNIKMWVSRTDRLEKDSHRRSSKSKEEPSKVNRRSYKDEREHSQCKKHAPPPVSSGSSKLASIFSKGPQKPSEVPVHQVEQKLQEKMSLLEKLVKGGEILSHPNGT